MLRALLHSVTAVSVLHRASVLRSEVIDSLKPLTDLVDVAPLSVLVVIARLRAEVNAHRVGPELFPAENERLFARPYTFFRQYIDEAPAELKYGGKQNTHVCIVTGTCCARVHGW